MTTNRNGLFGLMCPALTHALACGGLALAVAACPIGGAAPPSGPCPVDEPGLRFVGIARQAPQPADVADVEVSLEDWQRMFVVDDRNPPASILVMADGRMYRDDQIRAPRIVLLEELDDIPDALQLEPIPSLPQVLRADERSMVDAALLDDYPFRAIGRIGTCTGVLIGPRHVLTAAHCLHDDQGTWYWPLTFRPGVDGLTAINGEARRVVARRAYEGYEANRSWDIGLVVLEDEPETAALGRFGLRYHSNLDAYEGKDVFNYGYPGALNQCPGQLCGGHMWGMGCNITSVSPGQLRHSCDTQGGHSGSPVYELVDGRRRVIGVHWGSPGRIDNAAARIRPIVAEDLCTWMSGWPSDHGSMPACAQ